MAEWSNNDVVFSTSDYCGELNRMVVEDEDVVTPEALENVALVRSTYSAKTPLHSKEVMRNILTQLKSDSHTISVKAIDGRLVPFQRETGKTHDADMDSEFCWLIGKPFMMFFSVQEILDNVQQYPAPFSACSVWIYHELIKQHRVTGELVRRIPDQSKEQVVRFFDINRLAWEATDECSQVCSILGNNFRSQITKIIAFACGGMAFNNRIPWATNSAFQHALVLTIRKIVISYGHQTSMVECYAQDPIYCDLDRELLEMHEIKVLDSPEGFLQVDDSSILLSFGPDIAIRQVIADIARPAVMIWDRHRSMSNDIQDDNSSDPDAPHLTEMLHKFYDNFAFPGRLDAFRNIAIYIRKNNIS